MRNAPHKQTLRATGRIGLEFDIHGIFCAQVRKSGRHWHLAQSRTFCATEEILSGLRSDSTFVPFTATELIQAAAGFQEGEVAGVIPAQVCGLRVRELDLTGSSFLQTDGRMTRDAVQTMLDAGFTIAGMDGLPPACARAVSLMDAAGLQAGNLPDSGSDSRLRLVVHIGWKRCMLILVRDSIPIFARVSGVEGLSSFLSNSGEDTGLTPRELLRSIRGIRDRQLQTSQRVRARLDAAVRNWCLPIGEEILQSIATAHRPGLRRVPSKAIVMGSGGVIPGLAEILSEELNIEVRIWQIPADDNVGNGPEYAVAAALSAWDVE